MEDIKKETENMRLLWKVTTKIKNITEIRQLDTVRDESYRAQQFTVWVVSIAVRLTCRLRPTR